MPTRASESKTCETVARALLFAALLAASLAALVAPGADARAQLSRPPRWKDARCTRLSRAQAAFVGRVKGFERVTLKVNPLLGGGTETVRLVRFAVEEGFKGVEGREVGVLTQPAEPPTPRACGRDFEAGGRYLVYAYSWHRQPELRTDFCRGGGVPVAEAAADLAYLRAFAKGEPVAEVAGRVEQYRQEYPTTSLKLVRALEGVEVTAEGFGRSLKTKTDAEGRYHFGGLAPGTYTLHVNVPEGFYTPVHELPAYAGESACYQADFWLHSDGRVAGRVTDPAGRPVAGAALQLVTAGSFPADESKINDDVLNGPWATTDLDGRFEFRGVPGGRYLLGTNLRGITDYVPVEGKPPLIFPRTYYPGTSARAAAAVLEVPEGGRVSGLELMLVPPVTRDLVQREVAGEVVLADGRPAPCAMVSLVGMKGGRAVSGGVTEMRVLEGGRFTVYGYEGYTYAVRARVPVNDARGANVGSVAAEPVVFTPTATTPPLRLVIPPEGNCDFMTRPKH